MNAQAYQRLADECLAAVAEWLEDFDPDEVDYGTSDGVVTLEFPDGVRFVLNRQAAASQMWFAAGARAWHYNWDEAAASLGRRPRRAPAARARRRGGLREARAARARP